MGESSAEGTAPSTAATAAPAAEVPLSQFNTLYQYSLVASRTTAPAIGGAVGLCIASPNGTAYVVGIGKNVPNDVSTWDETAQMTLRGVRHNTLIQYC